MSLPGILARVAAVAGESAALRLAQAAGGTVMSFSPRPNAALARIVGAEAAKAIHAELGSERYAIPMANVRGERGRRIAAAQLLAKGASPKQAALAVDVHIRTVQRVRSKLNAGEDDDLPLFRKT